MPLPRSADDTPTTPIPSGSSGGRIRKAMDTLVPQDRTGQLATAIEEIREYPSLIDDFQRQFLALAEMARDGNPYAYSTVVRLQELFKERIDHAAQVAAILDHTIDHK